MANNQRRQLVVERILEDERLRGDLEDAPAKALLEWATKQADTIAADASRTDEQVDADVQTVRRATLLAADSGESDPKTVVALAAAQLGGPPKTATLSDQENDAPATAPAAQAKAAETIPAPEALPAPIAEQAASAPATKPQDAAHTQNGRAKRRRNKFSVLLKQLRRGR